MKHKCRYKHNYPQVTVIHKHYHYYIDDHFKSHEPYDRVSDWEGDLAHSQESNSDRHDKPDYWEGSLGGGFSSDW